MITFVDQIKIDYENKVGTKRVYFDYKLPLEKNKTIICVRSFEEEVH